MSSIQHRIWCDEDEHFLYENFVDFNAWLDGEDAEDLRSELGLSNLTQPSKALFAGDREAYDQTFLEFRNARRHEALNEDYFSEQFGSDHWFKRNLDHFRRLVNRIESEEVVPFIGAGISVAGGFPTWEEHLHEQGRTANLAADHIQNLIDQGEYEIVIEEIENIRSKDVFVQEMRDVFSRTGTLPDVVWRISELFSDTLITTNYDHLLEQAFDNGISKIQIINGKQPTQPEAKSTTVIKLHGDIRKPNDCVLSKQQYDDAYGEKLDLNQPVPKLLSYYYKNSSLLFLGCSLNADRTLEVFDLIRKSSNEEQDFPEHFSIEQAPEEAEELAARNDFLIKLGITPIWFQKDRYEYIEDILSLTKSEINYRKGSENKVIHVDSTSLDLEPFLRDFIDAMPLIYWAQKSIPSTETQKYLKALQRVFYGQSLFTESLNEDLSSSLDNLLRAISNNANFDGYTYGKLSIAFDYFQNYLSGKGLGNHSGSDLDWNDFELFSVPLVQYERLINKEDNSIEQYAIRLIVILLRYGKKQSSSSNAFQSLPDSISYELTDFLSITLNDRFNMVVPERLDESSNEGIRDLCSFAWENFDKPFKMSFIDRIKMALPSF